MPTRTELVAELEALRRELAEARAQAGQPEPEQAGTPDESPEEETGEETGQETGEAHASPLSWAISQLEDTELDTLAKQFIAELEDLHHDKPLVTVFAAFVLGYVLGRAR
ncbi:hypothetical protein [Tropicimonas sediminicola]|uniref:Uncharacterized protein n=1 Tax=Tropicimonas sediminicola TaxID=1031541 RepID=A0A239KE99_9RHOB|nr:hypothetical protein [Tropicimonas sediminicola]SNT16032.1 hypothetical protein SAMN05421757_10730 [Tropicimonas sediminicola]